MKQRYVWVRPHERKGKKGVASVKGHLRRVRGGKGDEQRGEVKPALPLPQLISAEEGGWTKVRLGVEASRIWDVTIAAHHSGRQLVHQLLQNALDATARNEGKVYVRWERRAYEGKGNGFRFVVADEGEGVPKEKLRLLFDLGASEKPEAALGGFGIGKAAAYGVASELMLLVGYGRDEEGRLQFTQIRATRDQIKQGEVDIRDIKLTPEEAETVARELGIPSLDKIKVAWVVDVYPTLDLTEKEVTEIGNEAYWALSSIMWYGDPELTGRLDVFPRYGRAEREFLRGGTLPDDPETTYEISVVRKGTPSSEATRTVNIAVLNNGLYQHTFYHSLRRTLVSSAYDTLVVNIKTKRSPEDRDYPWTLSRELKEKVREFISEAVETALAEELGQMGDEEALYRDAPPVGKTGFQLLVDMRALRGAPPEARGKAVKVIKLAERFLVGLDRETKLLSGLRGAVQYLAERVRRLDPELRPADPDRLQSVRFLIQPAKEGSYSAYYSAKDNVIVLVLQHTLGEFHFGVTKAAKSQVPSSVSLHPSESEGIIKNSAGAVLDSLLTTIAHELAHTRFLDHSHRHQAAIVQIASILKETKWYKRAARKIETVFRKVVEAKEAGSPVDAQTIDTLVIPEWTERDSTLLRIESLLRRMQEAHEKDYIRIFPSLGAVSGV